MTKVRKIIVMSSLVFLLAVTAVLNVVLANDKVIETGNITTVNYFSTFRTERTNTRNEELLQLDNVLATVSQESERYQDAAEMKLKLVSMMENELTIEGMIKSLGFSDAVVSIGMDSNNVNVFINSNELDYDTALSVYNLLKNEIGVASNNIIIMPVYAQI